MSELAQENNYTPLSEPVSITQHDWPEGTVPLVTIACITYNHVNFIRDAIEAFLMQETTFPVEILIHDDASTDGTADIVRSYELRHPTLIKPVYQIENQYSKGRKPHQIYLPLIKSRFIAMCEGDDYWQDPLKIQKQVSFLNENPDFSITYHDFDIISMSGELIKQSRDYAYWKRDMSAEEIASGYAFLPNLSRVFRNIFSEVPNALSAAPHGDRVFQMLLGLSGRGKFMSSIQPAYYRLHANGVYSAAKPVNRVLDQILTATVIAKYLHEIGEVSYADVWQKKVLKLAFRFSPVSRALAQFGLHVLELIKKKVGNFLGGFLAWVKKLKNNKF